MNQTVAIISLVIIAVIVAGVVVGAYWFFGKIQENNYCNNWFSNLEDRRIQMENAGFWESMNYDYDQYNAEVADYNRECYY